MLCWIRTSNRSLFCGACPLVLTNSNESAERLDGLPVRKEQAFPFFLHCSCCLKEKTFVFSRAFYENCMVFSLLWWRNDHQWNNRFSLLKIIYHKHGHPVKIDCMRKTCQSLSKISLKQIRYEARSYSLLFKAHPAPLVWDERLSQETA